MLPSNAVDSFYPWKGLRYIIFTSVIQVLNLYYRD